MTLEGSGQRPLPPVEKLTKETRPHWLEVLLHPNNSGQVTIRAGEKGYYLDLRDTQDGWNFLTMYDPVTRQPLIQADFQLMNGSLQLHFLPKRRDYSEMFANDQTLLENTNYNTHAFDWLTHTEEKDRKFPRYSRDIDRSRRLFLYIIGQIARAKGVLRIERPQDFSSPRDLYWHRDYVEYIQKGLESKPTSSVAVFGSKSEKKRVLADQQKDIFLIDIIAPEVAEADKDGKVTGREVEWDFAYRAEQPIIQTRAQRREHMLKTASQKAVGGIRDESFFPVMASDTAGLCVIDPETGEPLQDLKPEDITDNSVGITTAKGWLETDKMVEKLPGATILVHTAHAIATKIIPVNIPLLRIDQKDSQHFYQDMGESLVRFARKGLIVGTSDIQEIMICFRKDTPIELLKRSLSVSSGLGVDYYPGGEMDQELARYTDVWINKSGKWEAASLAGEEIRGVILGFSPAFFKKLWNGVYPEGYPIIIEDKLKELPADISKEEQERKLGRLRAAYTFLSHLVKPGTSMVDFGSWIGRYLHIPAMRANITAIDKDLAACGEARQNIQKYGGEAAKKINIRYGNITATGLLEDSQDIVTMMEVAEYFEGNIFEKLAETEKAIREARRITRTRRPHPRDVLFQPAFVMSTRIEGTSPNKDLGENSGIFNEERLRNLLEKYYGESKVWFVYQKANGEITAEQDERDSKFLIALCYQED